MIKAFLGAAAFLAVITTPALALDAKAYVGTWDGKTSTGKSIEITIPAGVDKGASVSYVYDGQTQAPQTPVVIGSKIKLTNPGPTFIILGPVHGKKLPYAWSDGSKVAKAVLVKQ